MVKLSKSFVFALLVVAMVGAASLSAQQQQPPLAAQQVACVGFQNSVDVRAEGSAEQLGDINYQCTVSVSDQFADPDQIPNFVDTSIRVTLNSVPIANRDISASFGVANLVDAIAEFNSNRTPDPRPTSTFISDRTGFGVDPRFPIPQYGVKDSDFSVLFLELAFPMPGSPNPDIPGLPFTTGSGVTIDEWDERTDGNSCLDPNQGFANAFCFPFQTQFRITNLRGNVARLGGPGVALFPATQVLAFVSTEGPTNVVLNTIQFVVGAPRQGLFVTQQDPMIGLQCVQSAIVKYVKLTEGFPSAFRTLGIPTFTPGQTQWEDGYPSFQEGTTTILGGQPISGINGGGASQATRFLITFINVPDGVEIMVPYQVQNVADASPQATDFGDGFVDGTSCLSGKSPDTSPTLELALVPSAGPNGDAGTVTTNDPDCPASGANVNIVNGFGFAVYEVTENSAFVLEMAAIPFKVSWTPDLDNDLPEVASMQLNASFAPLSTLQMSDAGGPIPRFQSFEEPQTALTIQRCVTVLLFPWVTNRSGFDTGFAVANTSDDWLGTPNQTGACTIHFHGETAGGGAVEEDTQTSIPIPAGDVLLFTLSGGNLDYGITGAPEFSGYVIAVCEFQFAHGFAFITDGFGGIPTLAQGYLALVVHTARIGAGGRSQPDLLRNGMESLDQ